MIVHKSINLSLFCDLVIQAWKSARSDPLDVTFIIKNNLKYLQRHVQQTSKICVSNIGNFLSLPQVLLQPSVQQADPSLPLLQILHCIVSELFVTENLFNHLS